MHDHKATREHRFGLEPRREAPAELPAAAADARLLTVTVLGAALVVSSLVFLVWVRMAEMQAGYRLYSLQREKVALRQERSKLELELAALRRPERLARAAKDLGLGPAEPGQLMRATAGSRP
jgi:cell division protein FtsL